MKNIKLVTYQAYGRDDKPTIYLFTGYESTIDDYIIPIKAINLSGFRIVAFDYDASILRSGDSDRLPQSIDYCLDIVKRDSRDRVVAGVYGISLGSTFALNILKNTSIDRAVINTGGVSLVKAIWTKARMKSEKANFIKKGETSESLMKKWRRYDISQIAGALSGRHILFMNSEDDEVISYNEVKSNIAEWRSQAVRIETKITYGLRHGHTIIRNFLRLAVTRKFFRQGLAHKE